MAINMSGLSTMSRLILAPMFDWNVTVGKRALA